METITATERNAIDALIAKLQTKLDKVKKRNNKIYNTSLQGLKHTNLDTIAQIQYQLTRASITLELLK